VLGTLGHTSTAPGSAAADPNNSNRKSNQEHPHRNSVALVTAPEATTIAVVTSTGTAPQSHELTHATDGMVQAPGTTATRTPGSDAQKIITAPDEGSFDEDKAVNCSTGRKVAPMSKLEVIEDSDAAPDPGADTRGNAMRRSTVEEIENYDPDALISTGSTVGAVYPYSRRWQ